METVLVPLLFNFLFVKFSPDTDNWPAIRYAEGVRQILTTSSGRPVPVEVGWVERMIESAKVLSQPPDLRMAKLQPGTLVRVVSREPGRFHPFDGEVVEVIECDGNITIGWVQFLGGRRKANFARSDLVDE